MDPNILLDNCLVIGAKGSGKTSLGAVLLDGVLKTGAGACVIDTSGDLTSRLQQTHELPLLRNNDAPDDPGAPIVLRSLDAAFAASIFHRPSGPAGEADAEELEDLVAAFLGLMGFERPRPTQPVFSLIANAVAHEWREGRDVDLADLERLVETPPFDRIGVFALDAVISPDRRSDLVGAIRGVRETPSFAVPSAGRAIQSSSLFAAGQATVVSFSVRSNRTREFVVAVLLAKLKGHAIDEWSGSGDSLRMMLYVDEAAVLLPPHSTLTTRPLLDALKTWRSYDVGVVLVAEDLGELNEDVQDHCQTWLVGRLPVPQTRRRVADALDLINPPVDEVALEQTLKSHPAGSFVLRSMRMPQLTQFSMDAPGWE